MYPVAFTWSPSLFTPTLDYLPGLPSTHKHFGYVTYPRLGALGKSTMFMSLRDGKAGLGSDHLYLYRSSTGFWEFVGTPLTGVQSNPYVHGWDFRGGRLHVTWVYRGFVHYEGWDDPADTKHKQQAGPNGAENNHNVCYAYSEDLGYTWKNGNGKVIADLSKGETIDNSSEGIVAFNIPKGSGLMNQEAQAVDQDGGIHILNRDTLDGINVWRHYYRSPSAAPVIRILKAAKSNGYAEYEDVWVGNGLSGEPLIDGPRLASENVLSVVVGQDVDGSGGKRNVAVLDFAL
ncbi:hypothetical protein SLS63_002607 [Diaporthe eres]|uniref:Dockerin type 1 n=1 Tax=Diaporthe eres TaxID=83184 RepID=A0ABR1PK01_DIAER